MREFKFRAWDKWRKEMVVVVELNFESREHRCISDGVVTQYGVGNLILMQYIGLKDKNKKEIYEGDIISNGSEKVVIEYGNQNCSCCNKVFGYDLDYSYIDLDEIDYEIIGNIYENPELVE